MNINEINELYYQSRIPLNEQKEQEDKLKRWDDATQMARGEMPRADMFDTPEKSIEKLKYYMLIVHNYLQNEVLPELQNNEPEVARKILQGLLDTVITPITEIIKK